ncbi:MAG: DNA-directed RNA polymerase subunit K [Thermoproteota archaeon]
MSISSLKNSIEKRIEVSKKRLTKFEKARIIGLRALELSLGAPPLIPVEHSSRLSAAEIATQEVMKKILPLIIGRRMPDGSYVYVPLSDLEIED